MDRLSVFGSVHSRVVLQGFHRAGAGSVDSRQKASRSVLIATIAGSQYLLEFRCRGLGFRGLS